MLLRDVFGKMSEGVYPELPHLADQFSATETKESVITHKGKTVVKFRTIPTGQSNGLAVWNVAITTSFNDPVLSDIRATYDVTLYKKNGAINFRGNIAGCNTTADRLVPQFTLDGSNARSLVHAARFLHCLLWVGALVEKCVNENPDWGRAILTAIDRIKYNGMGNYYCAYGVSSLVLFQIAALAFQKQFTNPEEEARALSEVLPAFSGTNFIGLTRCYITKHIIVDWNYTHSVTTPEGDKKTVNPLISLSSFYSYDHPEIGWIKPQGAWVPDANHYICGSPTALDGEMYPSGWLAYLEKQHRLYTCQKCSVKTAVSLLKGQCQKCCPVNRACLRVLSYSTDVTKELGFRTPSIPKPKSSLAFSAFQKAPLLFGCELEYNVREEGESETTRLHFLEHLSNRVIFKGDGSLRAGGFEMVTLPLRYHEHMALFRPVFDEFPDNIKRNDGTAGMHIHVTKAAVTMLTLARCVDFMHNGDNEEFLKLIAERTLTSYCHQDKGRGFGFVLLSPDGGARHVSLNTCKNKTFEFRIFRSPYSWESYAKNVQFADRLIHMMQAGWSEFTPKQSRHYGSFIKYVAEQNKSKKAERNTSPELYEFMKKKGVYS